MTAAPALLNLLRWVAERPRSYGEAMEAWRSSCPRLSVWEDALADGLIAPAPHAGPAGTAPNVLTARGHAALADAGG
jgi:hypothetical protein